MRKPPQGPSCLCAPFSRVYFSWFWVVWVSNVIVAMTQGDRASMSSASPCAPVYVRIFVYLSASDDLFHYSFAQAKAAWS